jgi:transposase InsO family protein
MPWKVTSAMDDRLRFVGLVLSGESSVSRLCAEFGISRQCGYKWLGRYRTEGAAGLQERSSAPLRHGRLLDDEIVSAVLALRERWPSWGARKLRAKLLTQRPELVLPAASTIGAWLHAAGCTSAPARHRRTPIFPGPFASIGGANDVWCADFKGWFLTADGQRCDPLTITDAYSRYILCCQGVAGQDEASARPVFERLFRQHGLPLALRSDNGVPFASVGAGGLSRLSVWWLKLGIAVERIAPGRPQQNGRHERMHRTLKAETASPPAACLAAQQVRFDRFRAEFNSERPHEGLGQLVPASAFVASPRAYPAHLREVEYDAGCAVRRVRSNGQIKWAGDMIFVSEVLVGELVGVTETDTGDWQVRFAGVDLGYVDSPRRRLSRHPIRSRKRPVDLMESASALPTTPQAHHPQTPAFQ